MFDPECKIEEEDENEDSEKGTDNEPVSLPVPDVEEDVCSICLDEFTISDPGADTVCGHTFHLQCIMQWAQRSRDCPLCYKSLQLQDASMNELMPFGEFSPPVSGPTWSSPQYMMGIESWELERMLLRLSVNNGRHGHAQGRARGGSAGGASVAAPGPSSSASSAAQPCGEGASSSSGTPQSAAQHQADSLMTPGAYPASWPPASGRQSSPRGGSPFGHGGANRYELTTGTSDAFSALRSRWAAASSRCKESITKTTSHLKLRWGQKPGNQQLPSRPEAPNFEPGPPTSP